MQMEEDKIAKLLKEAMNEPPAPKRLVERTCWKARAAEARFAREAGVGKSVKKQMQKQAVKQQSKEASKQQNDAAKGKPGGPAR